MINIRPFSFADFPVIVHSCPHCCQISWVALQACETPEGARLRIGEGMLYFDNDGKIDRFNMQVPGEFGGGVAARADLGENVNPEPFPYHDTWQEVVYETAARGDWITVTSRLRMVW